MHAYVINLARSVDRREHITAELERTGIGYEIVSAVDGNTVDLRDPAIVDPVLIAKNDFPAGTAGCALSHLRAYEKILVDGHDHALVLEDDVRLPADLHLLSKAMTPHMPGAEVALLNYGSRDGCRVSLEEAVGLPGGRRLALPIELRTLVNAAA